MNIEASHETLSHVAETLKLASLLDDRVARADKARIVAWSEQIERHHLSRDDLLDGLQVFYDQAHPHAIGVGDLIQHARARKRTRLEKEADEERDQRRDELDEKAAADVLDFTAAAINARAKRRTKRLLAAEEALQTCHGKHESIAALTEYFEAKKAANGKKSPKREAL